MGKFTDDLNRASQEIERRTRSIFTGTAQELHRSIQSGSELTGAPGQPVDKGELRASYQLVFESEGDALIATHEPYARSIEEGIGKYGPLTLRSAIGGFHSIKLSVAGFPRIVAAVTRRVTGGA